MGSEMCIRDRGTRMGNVGGGNFVDRNEDALTAIPWALPKGDQTFVQLSREKGDAGGGDEGAEKMPKFSGGTLYAVLREIEAKSTTPIRPTSFGEVKPTSEGGRHTYQFACLPGAENHRALDFVPSPVRGKKRLRQTATTCSPAWRTASAVWATARWSCVGD